MDLLGELLGLEEKMWAANRAGDAGYYAKALRDDSIVVSRYGVMDRAAIIQGIGENRVPYIGSTITEPRAIGLTPDSALITYRVHVEALRDGQPMAFDTLATSIYVREDGGWKNAFHQQSAL
jgi:ketosteroid isomerase-like protein